MFTTVWLQMTSNIVQQTYRPHLLKLYGVFCVSVCVCFIFLWFPVKKNIYIYLKLLFI